jgi:D-alanyl-D-alanine carboxypeptidase
MRTRRLELAMWSLLQSACAAEAVATGASVAQVRTQLGRMVREQELPGAQYVARGADRVRVEAHVGVADVATGEPMRAGTLQMAYSLTKVVTAIAVMQLADAGKLDLDDPLSRHWPAHPYGTAVTLRSLLAHTSGVPNPMPLDWFVVDGERLDREAALRAVLAKHPERDHAVGEAYGYSNVGYWLLEKAIESASGLDYARYVEEHVFGPLSVQRDAVAFELRTSRAMATGHSRRFTPTNLVVHALTPARYWALPHRQWSRSARLLSLGRGYGGLWSSASALAAVLQDLLRARPKLLSASARDQMWAEQRTGDGEPSGNALGWVIGELNGVKYFGKQGGGLGFHGNARVYPELGLATLLLCNRTELTTGPIDARSDVLDAALVVRAGGAAP